MNLIRSAATVSGLTTASRVLGYVRDLLIAAVLGASPVADAFVVAFRLPNLFRRLFAEGAFNSAFVPLFAKQLEGAGEDGARRFGEEVLSALFATLVAFTALAELAMPLLVYVIAPGFAEHPEKFDLTVLLTRIAFPYLLFMSLVAFYSGVLNSLGRFAAAAAAPILLNIVLIGVLIVVASLGWGAEPRSGQAIVWGIAAAGLVQLAMLVVAARRAGVSFRLARPRLSPGVRRLLALGIPGVIAAGITQFNLLIGTIISSLQSGAPAWLYYADRIYQLPLGMVGIAIGVVLLPDLSRKLKADDAAGVMRTQNRAVELSMLLTIPAAVALIAMPLPVVHVLFQYGAFTAGDTTATAQALAAFALGLPAFVLIKVFSPNYFAHEDTRTPMLYAGAGMLVNVAGSLAMFFVIGHVGIALATSLAAWVNAGLLGRTLGLRGQFAPDDRLVRRLPRVLLASLVMGGVLIALVVWPFADVFVDATSTTIKIPALVALVAIGIGVFFGIARLLGAITLGELLQLARRR
ncbi:murein biosynthesis integral membrane protein MurJ [Kaustia mangrovi]|uniref:Probable lipid II flippase MurJ n=1 Tax=Kaustia mangrovi TaxID=2593653 RepID=A0A7S8HC77_9HYPH|nr:murein biosynthesis integral membrane protein MurJ [Kaustia mangrovi]QPC43422.1 murein biosynthesis integral membrane protein MurJ [Kaustia mangrovi]